MLYPAAPPTCEPNLLIDIAEMANGLLAMPVSDEQYLENTMANGHLEMAVCNAQHQNVSLASGHLVMPVCDIKKLDAYLSYPCLDSADRHPFHFSKLHHYQQHHKALLSHTHS